MARIISEGRQGEERATCPHCSTVFAYTFRDIGFWDRLDARTCHVECPSCHVIVTGVNVAYQT